MWTALHWVDGPWPGKLALAARPRGGGWLRDEIASWRAAGIDAVLSLLTPDEERDLSLEGEADEVKRQDLEFLSFPIQTRVAEALTALSDLDPNASAPFTPGDVQLLRARLVFSTKAFGGWVGERGLPRVYAKDVTKIEEMRGHNWDLLCQAAELNGMLFEPLRLAGSPPRSLESKRKPGKAARRRRV